MFTSFGYFDYTDNLLVFEIIARDLSPRTDPKCMIYMAFNRESLVAHTRLG
jgi:hypothetical protein